MNAGRLNMQYLSYLVTLVAECHVTRAADRAGISQPAMSAALARLRTLFKDPILVRTTVGMRPTARALELAEKAKVALELLRDAGDPAQAFDPARTEAHIRIMASEGVAEVVAPNLLSIVRQRAPRLQLTIRSGDIRRSAEYLRDGELEFAMAFTDQRMEEIHQLLLYPQRIVCLASRQHPRVQDTLTLEQFVAESHVVWGAEPIPYPALERLVDRALQAKRLTRKVIARVSSLSVSAALVARTDLLAVAPHRLVDRPDVTGVCRILPLPFKTEAFDVRLLWHERWHRDATHTWLRKAFRQVAKDLQARYART